MNLKNKNISGCGLGLRRQFIEEFSNRLPLEIDWIEIAPENYIDRGGLVKKHFDKIASHYPLVAHGLQLSIGSTDELNWDYLKKLKQFLIDYEIAWFSDHLCWNSSGGHYFHDLLPLPMTKKAVDHVCERIKKVQDFLNIDFAIENISFYQHPSKPEMSETEFIKEILNKTGCFLMLDINNIFVNSVNHDFDPKKYIDEICDAKIIQHHIAGHERRQKNLIIDTHGENIIDEVWNLLKYLATKKKLAPVLIERDNNIPPLDELIEEVKIAKKIYAENQCF